MKKNYYEILEVDKNASPEIIEKAYKTLVKKYHPDLQENNTKQKYEELVKLLNEAYEVLSNQEKRTQYDLKLQQEKLLAQQKNIINNNPNSSMNFNKNSNIKNSVSTNNTKPNNHTYNEDLKRKKEFEYTQKMNKAINKAYYDAYIQDLKNRGYKIKYKKSLKDYFTNLLAIIITFFIISLLLKIPFIKDYLYSNIFFKAIFTTFESFFTFDNLLSL